MRGHTQVIRGVIHAVIRGEPYARAIRRASFKWGLTILNRPYVEAIRKKAIFFLVTLPYAGHTEIHTRRSYAEPFFNGSWPYAGKPYTEVIRIIFFDIYIYFFR